VRLLYLDTCPSNIPLVQQFRVAKQILREKTA
jgi:Na+-translocating ferredoxin:NAD+ oxidoreductase RnfC subunit